MVRSMTTRGMPKPFAILIAALLALYFVPLGALPAQAVGIGGFEIDMGPSKMAPSWRRRFRARTSRGYIIESQRLCRRPIVCSRKSP